jgi:SagB-type dehydrogenase family enzyme
MTRSGKQRTTPSAGALYPLEVYLVAGRVESLAAGVYRYNPSSHQLLPIADGDGRRKLSQAALEQAWVAEAPASIVLTAVRDRLTRKYGGRALRYVILEAGCAAQNVSLQAITLGLGSVHVGAFDDAAVSGLLGAVEDEEPLLLIAVGHPRSADDLLDAAVSRQKR